MGLSFCVLPSDAVEDNLEGEPAAEMVVRLSRAKAMALEHRAAGRLIIAADTTVALDGRVLGKPNDSPDAERMLRQLRGRTHTVYSGLTLLDSASGRAQTALIESRVQMRRYRDPEIATYVASGDPLDKAGSYAIQYSAFRPVSRIVGCYANVMGFPLCHLYCLLRDFGVVLASTPRQACNRFNGRRCRVADQILSEHCGELTSSAAAQPLS
jgi:septum formation protein